MSLGSSGSFLTLMGKFLLFSTPCGSSQYLAFVRTSSTLNSVTQMSHQNLTSDPLTFFSFNQFPVSSDSAEYSFSQPGFSLSRSWNMDRLSPSRFSRDGFTQSIPNSYQNSPHHLGSPLSERVSHGLRFMGRQDLAGNVEFGHLSAPQPWLVGCVCLTLVTYM